MLQNKPKDNLDALVIERICDHCGRHIKQINTIETYYKRTKRSYTEDFAYDDLCDSCAIGEYLLIKQRLENIGFIDYLTGKSMEELIKVAYSDYVDCKYCGKSFFLPDVKQEIKNYENYFNDEFGFACHDCAKERIDAFESFKQIEVELSNTAKARIDGVQKSMEDINAKPDETTEKG